jgi:SPX domain protein involved in polyphosphate accumulation
MKFGEYLRSQQVEEWRNSYIDYDKLKKMIKQLEDSFVSNSQSTGEKGKEQSSSGTTLDD